MALADGALESLQSWDDIRAVRLPEGRDHVSLKWKKEAEDLPLLRHVDRNGHVTKEPMKKAVFTGLWRSLLLALGYFGFGGVHMIRRALGKTLDGKYYSLKHQACLHH
jgi:hypothetical protein